MAECNRDHSCGCKAASCYEKASETWSVYWGEEWRGRGQVPWICGRAEKRSRGTRQWEFLINIVGLKTIARITWLQKKTSWQVFMNRSFELLFLDKYVDGWGNPWRDVCEWGAERKWQLSDKFVVLVWFQTTVRRSVVWSSLFVSILQPDFYPLRQFDVTCLERYSK